MRRPLRSCGIGHPLCVFTLLAFGPAVLGATSYSIITTADDAVVNGNCTLREAIRASNTNAAVDLCPAGGAADSIKLPSGTYPFVGEETVSGNGSLTIESQTLNPFDVTIDLGGGGRFLLLLPSGSYVFGGLEIANGVVPAGQGGAAISAFGVSLLIYNFRFVSNAGGGGGGAIIFGSNQAAASLVIHDGAFLSNTTVGTGVGGAAGGAAQLSGENGADVDLRDIAFIGNQASSSASSVSGGALHLEVADGGSVGRCIRCSFSNNSATSTAGAGSSNANGGAVYIRAHSGARAELIDGQFFGNSAASTADPQTAAIAGHATSGGSLVLDRLLIDFNVGAAEPQTRDVDLLGQGAASNVSFLNSQVTFGAGGGLTALTDALGAVLLGHLTIADYDLTGASLDGGGGQISLQNSIVSFNSGTNLETFGSVGQTSNFVGGDPLFVNLGAGDYHLNDLSPAINAGTNGAASVRLADLDHGGRIAGPATDIGCYEHDGLFADDFGVGDTGSWSSHTP